ncbi:hypothetical protein CDIK_3723 [Cucumispora dikerogammari]|nr:hypothetical protein CDIK_3723 [Cucumispora dikerogammari]
MKEYARIFLNEDSLGKKVKVFIDESGFNSHLRRTLVRYLYIESEIFVTFLIKERNVLLISELQRKKFYYLPPLREVATQIYIKIFFTDPFKNAPIALCYIVSYL